MELEFDKEIDAILRKARGNTGVTEVNSAHIDADAIAAFVENALPDTAKRLYMEHFADCDKCRKQLSFAVQMTEVAAAENSSAPVVSETKTETVPWYQGIFRTPNIALTMGALVLAFGGVLGYLVLQRQSGTMNETLSQVREPEQQRASALANSANSAAMPTASEVPSIAENMNRAPANSAANSASVMGAIDEIATTKSMPNLMAAPAANAAPRSEQFQVDGASGAENNFIIDGQEVGNAKTASKPAAASQPVTTDSSASGVAAERDEKKADDKVSKEEPKDTDLAKRKMEDRAMRRDAPPPPAKSGPMQSNKSNVGQMTVTRTVGGKTFSNRDGAWYDSAYQNQATTNVRRGTNEYKKLDSGLRNIADTLGGTVVVVWKAKAYRIQ